MNEIINLKCKVTSISRFSHAVILALKNAPEELQDHVGKYARQ